MNRWGTVASFFTYWDGPNWSVGQWNEIDVEIVPSVMASNTSPYSTNLIYGSGADYNKQEQAYEDYNRDFSQFHTYEIEWTPDYISWKIDGWESRRTWANDSEGVRFMNKYQHLMMNFWTPTWSPWGDNLNDGDMPWYVNYDFVEVYDYNKNTREFTLNFRDDFNGDWIDTNRWYVSDGWGFDSNSSIFVKDHVYQYNGNLVLKMDINWGEEVEQIVL